MPKNVVTALQSLIEDHYDAHFTNKDFTRPFLDSVYAYIATFGPGASAVDRYRTILAKAMVATMDPYERQQFLSEVNAPYDLVALIEDEANHEWPVSAPYVAQLEQNLPALREAMKAKIDWTVGQQRLLYVTDIAGQDMIYLNKANEAVACLADGDPQPATYPLLSVDLSNGLVSALTGQPYANITEVAQAISAINTQWYQLSVFMENVRLGKKQAVMNEALTTAEDIYAAAAIDWAALYSAAGIPLPT